MDTQHLLNVLNMLRLMKGQQLATVTPVQLIAQWSGKPTSEGLALKAAANIQDEIELASIALSKSHLSEESKEGIIPKLHAFRSAFSLGRITSSLHPSVPDLAGMITTLAVVIDAAGVQQQIEPPKEVYDLGASIEECIANLDPEMDPVLREVAEKHMAILLAMLQNLKIFGVEAAYTSYFELMTKVQRADAHSSPADKEKSKPLIEKLKSWSEVMATIQKIWDASSGLVTSAAKVVPLLSHNATH